MPGLGTIQRRISLAFIAKSDARLTKMELVRRAVIQMEIVAMFDAAGFARDARLTDCLATLGGQERACATARERVLQRLKRMAPRMAKQTKSELFRDLLPLLNCGRIVLPRNERLLGQIVGLERRTSAVGRDTISHPDRGHDDVANAVAGAAALSKFGLGSRG